MYRRYQKMNLENLHYISVIKLNFTKLLTIIEYICRQYKT